MKLKIAFIFPPFLPNANKYPYSAPHLLATILEEKGHSVDIYDFNLEISKTFITKEYLNIAKDILKPDEMLFVDGHKVSTNQAKKILQKIIEQTNKYDFTSNDVPEYMYNQLNNLLTSIFFPPNLNLEDYLANGNNWPHVINEIFQEYAIKVMKNNFDVICFSAPFGEQFIQAVELAKRMRIINPLTPFLIGGAQISLLDSPNVKLLKEDGTFQLIYQGYAERDIEKMIHLALKRKDTIVIKNDPITKEDLNNLPFIKVRGLENYYEGSQIPVIVSKGCFWGQCEFCDYIIMGDIGNKKYIIRDPEIVIEEIAEIRKKYPDVGISLVSDAVPPKWYLELAKLAIKKGIQLKTSSYILHSKFMDENWFKTLREAGVNTFTFGTESTVDRILGLMKKHATKDVIKNNILLSHKYNFFIQVNMIPNFPTTTYAEAMECYQDIYELKHCINSLAVFKFWLASNTGIANNPEKFGLSSGEAPYLSHEQSIGYHRIAVADKDKALTPEETEEIFQKFNRLGDLICKNNFINKELENVEAIESIEFVKNVIDIESKNGFILFYNPRTLNKHIIQDHFFNLYLDIPKNNLIKIEDFSKTIKNSKLSAQPLKILKLFYNCGLIEKVKFNYE